ncbi:apolipoprotein N-acyltransferase [Argonema antarcticum]|uniref:apolipoprotein N-acyltransferase n=1 Tax=Argonema antarcticum TaxID=2942763 RepID=UPI00201216FE|nr:apolipoprotein N-acyltransferase [Argonema antarcticum]MCL1470109.1 apolipoprotein N-acyltransferase [Argonema antarcticum A004/B2]
MGLTTAPVSAWLLAWIALIPLWIVLVKYERKKSKFFLFPLLWGSGYYSTATFWITGIHPMDWLGVPWLQSLLITILCWTFISLCGAAVVVFWAIASRGIFHLIENPKSPIKNSLFRILIGTALWCGLETLCSSGSLWWTSISYTQSPHNLAILHLGQISGPNTITAAIVAVNGLIAELGIGKEKHNLDRVILSKLIIVISVLAGLHLIGFALYNRPLNQPPETALKVGIIQGNIPNKIKFNSAGWYRAIEGYTTGYRTLADQGVDAVLIPETALPFVWTDPNQIPHSFYSAVMEKGVIAWVGGFGQQGRNLTNSLFTITGDGKIFSRYNKVKLVPLGEYIPFEEFLGSLIEKLSPLDANLVHGKLNQVFDTPFGRAIVGICYDSAFSKLFRRQAANGGEFILSASNDAHYRPSMAAQHHAQDIMRAIETGRWAVRATNTGYSAIIDPHGQTQWLSRINTYELHAATIYRQQSQTLYVRWGDWLTPLLLLLAALTPAVEYHLQKMNNN